MSETIAKLRTTLRNSIDSTPERVSIFFKTGPGDYAEHEQFLGITVPSLRKIAKTFRYISLEDIQVLIQSPFNEERLLALIILVHQYKTPINRDNIYDFYLKHLHQVNNWNLVDSSAHLIIGAHLLQQDRTLLIQLASSNNLWERRIAIVATWYFIRNSDLDWTFKIADLLRQDSHDLIHKAVGWMLREAGKKDEARLVAYLCEHATQMPKTMLRYAMERLAKTQKMRIIS